MILQYLKVLHFEFSHQIILLVIFATRTHFIWDLLH